QRGASGLQDDALGISTREDRAAALTRSDDVDDYAPARAQAAGDPLDAGEDVFQRDPIADEAGQDELLVGQQLERVADVRGLGAHGSDDLALAHRKASQPAPTEPVGADADDDR